MCRWQLCTRNTRPLNCRTHQAGEGTAIRFFNSRFAGLWLDSRFRRFWAGQSTALLGTQVVNLAIPLTAVIELDASPFQMGLVTAMTGVPAVFGLFLGTWVDRHPRLPVLAGSTIARALLIAIVPVAYFTDSLSIELLYFVAFGIGFFTMLFSIGYRSVLPSLVDRGKLVEANSKLELAGSGTSAIGPGVGGVLVQIVSAPIALLSGAAMYLISASLFARIRADEDSHGQSKRIQTKSDGTLGGVKYFFQNRTLIGIGGSQLTLVVFSAGFISIGLLYMVQELELNAATIGIILSTGRIGSFLGAAINTRVSARYGVGRVMAGGLLAVAVTAAALPSVAGATIVVAFVLVVAMVVGDAGNVMYSIAQVSVRQAVTADQYQGRVSSIFAMLVRLGWPIGGLAAGTLAEFVGLRFALFVGAAATAGATIWLIYFRVWNIKRFDGRPEPSRATGA
jgi:MFS family permease